MPKRLGNYDSSTPLEPVELRNGSVLPVATPASGPVIQVIGIDSAQGQRLIGTANASWKRRGGG